MTHPTQRQDAPPKPSVVRKLAGAGSTRPTRPHGATSADEGGAPGAASQGGRGKPLLVGGVPRKARGAPGAAQEAFRSKAFRDLLRRDPVIARAMAELASSGAVTGTRSRKISTRVDPGLMDAAKRRFGLTSEADVINASLAVAGAPDRFKQWLRNPQHTLTDDFEPAI